MHRPANGGDVSPVLSKRWPSNIEATIIPYQRASTVCISSRSAVVKLRKFKQKL